MKRFAALSLMSALILSTCAASYGVDRLFGVSFMSMKTSYFIALKNAISDIAEYNDDSLFILDPERDQEKQNSQILEMIGEGVDAIFLAPVDSRGVKDALTACQKAGVPVINVDSPVYDEDLVACIVCSDNLEAGRACGKDLLKRLSGGKAVILENAATSAWSDRAAGFEEAVAAAPGFTIAVKRNCGGKPELARILMTDIIREIPDVSAVMCVTDPVALAVVDVLRKAGKLKDVLVYGVNGSPEAKSAIGNGEMAGSAAQSPISMGNIACDVAYKLLDGKKVDKHYHVPVVFISEENLDSFFLYGWQ